MASSISCGRRTHLRFPNKRLTEISTGPKDTLISPKFFFLFLSLLGKREFFCFYPPMAFREGNPLILDKKEKTRRRKRKLFFRSFLWDSKAIRAREFVPLFKATQPSVSLPPFLLPRWRRIFMNIKQGKTREVLFPFPQNVLLRTVHPCQKKWEEERIG